MIQLSIVSRLTHENFVGLLGYCLEADNKILVYQFATMGSLHDMLHGMTNSSTTFSNSWAFLFWRIWVDCFMVQGGKVYKGQSLVRF